MARSRSNIITKDYSGVVGKVIITKDGNIRSRPDNSERKLSPAQKAHLTRIEQAKEYGRWAIRDRESNDWYAHLARNFNGQGAWHMAIRDFYHPPVIESVNFNKFSGMAGDRIRIVAKDVFKVKCVCVCVLTANGGVIAKGPAVFDDQEMEWNWAPEQDILLCEGLKVLMQVMDTPGNIVHREFTYPFDTHRELGQAATPGRQQKKQYVKSLLRSPKELRARARLNKG